MGESRMKEMRRGIGRYLLRKEASQGRNPGFMGASERSKLPEAQPGVKEEYVPNKHQYCLPLRRSQDHTPSCRHQALP